LSDTSPDLKITLVPRDKVGAAWPRVLTLLEPAFAMAPGRFVSDDILNAVAKGTMQLWVVYRSADSTYRSEDIVASFTTKIYNVARARICVIEWAGGAEMERWVDDVIATVENFAKDCSCQRIEINGRRGWKKFVERHGWRFHSICYEKEL
jgi:hypothetical protein